MASWLNPIEVTAKRVGFEEGIVDNILKHEGGYQNDKADSRGNTNSLGESVGTNLGISAPKWEEALGRPPTAEDMKAITPAQARQFYKDRYIAPVSKEMGIAKDSPAYKQVVDMHVNHSPEAVKAMIQRAVGVKVDGKIGPKTIAAISKTKDINTKLVEERKKYYEQLMKSNPAFEAYRNGWLKRAESFR